jgi:hypothetical protein
LQAEFKTGNELTSATDVLYIYGPIQHSMSPSCFCVMSLRGLKVIKEVARYCVTISTMQPNANDSFFLSETETDTGFRGAGLLIVLRRLFLPLD